MTQTLGAPCLGELLERTDCLQSSHEQGEAFYWGSDEPGLVSSPELVQWLQELETSNHVTDTIAIEPSNGVALVLHSALMRNLGVTRTEVADLEQRTADCAEDAQYEVPHVATPLTVAKGSGSPVGPFAVT